jgi:hypothetical protein
MYWLVRNHFDPLPQQVVGEAFPTYVYSAGTVERIYADNIRVLSTYLDRESDY